MPKLKILVFFTTKIGRGEATTKYLTLRLLNKGLANYYAIFVFLTIFLPFNLPFCFPILTNFLAKPGSGQFLAIL